MNRRGFLIAAASPLVGAARPARHAAPPLDLPTLLQVMKTPGLAARSVIGGGRPSTHVGGVRATGKAEPVTAQTRFPAASLSKPVFAFAVRRLVREGKLDWSKPLQDYAPLGLTGDAATVTARHVLTHGTGFTNWRFDAKEELVSAFKPGTAWRYSGEGYVLLQRVVEAITGQPLGTVLNRTLLPSLGMTSSTFTWSPAVQELAVEGHDNNGLPMERPMSFYERGSYERAAKAGSTTEAMTYDETIAYAKKTGGFALPVGVAPNAAGSLWTTIDDYGQFLKATLDDYAAHEAEYAPINRVNAKIAWTLSWGVDSSLDAPGWFHWGDGPGVKNFAWWQPAKKTAVVIFTNGDHGASAYRWLLRRILEADPVAPDWI